MAVRWGRQHVCLNDFRVLGVDEIAWHKGHQYLTLVCQLAAGCRRLLSVGQHRTQKTLEDFIDWFGKDCSGTLQVVGSNAWKPYLTVIADGASQAVRVVDRFHSMKKLSEAIDKIRAVEARRLKGQGKQPVLKNSRWAPAQMARAPQRTPSATLASTPPAQPRYRPGLPAQGGVPPVL